MSTESDGKLLHAIEAIYDAAPDPSQWTRALDAIAACFGDVGALLMWRRDDASFGTSVSASLVQAQSDYEAGGWTRRDIGAIRAAQRGYFFSGEPYASRHLVSKQEIADDPFFVEFRRPHGLGPFGGVAVSPDPHIGVLLSVQGHAMRPDYSDEELATIESIGRHVEKSLRLSIRLLDAEVGKVGLGDALARIGIGVFGVDSAGQLVFSNDAGQRLIGDQVKLVHNRLRIGTGESRQAIDATLARMLHGDPRDLINDPKPILVHSPHAERRMVVYLLPVAPLASLAEQFLAHTKVIILAIEHKFDEPADPAVVRDILGLTLGEARIAALVGSGLPPAEAAERLGISVETSRNVLKRVFAKVGVSRQSELVSVMTKLVLR